MSEHKPPKWELSALLSVIGILILFGSSLAVVVVAPGFVDKSWLEPTSDYQVQMYEVSDPHVYISGAVYGGQLLQYVNHIVEDLSLIAFQESETVKIKASPDLQKYVTGKDDKTLKLTSKVLLLRPVEGDARGIDTYELYDPNKREAFSLGSADQIIENWTEDFILVDGPKQPFHSNKGVIYLTNPREYKIKPLHRGEVTEWRYDPEGVAVESLEKLKAKPLGFMSRKELIQLGEHIYAIEGCWYCHTDQTRTLVQDLVLNGSESYPAPPSSPNEYIYQKVTFPGTKRNGPDLSREGVRKPSRDWHKAHFWSPKTQSKGSIMPAFRHFFDFDPRGTSGSPAGVPNYQFEAVFQYLMTKGTRITPPTEAWWLGKDPVQTKAIIEGLKR
jgi:cytochrome c oxidase cbb3-type subunit 2